MRKESKISGRTGKYIFIAPTAVILSFFILYPLIFSLVISFYAYTFVSPGFDTFVGLTNYLIILKDKYFWNSLFIILKFVGLVVPLEFLVGFTIALLLNRKIKLKSFFYAILVIPMLISPVAVALMWRMLLHPQLGIVNYMLSLFKVQPVNWLGSSKTAFLTIVMVDIWQSFSFTMLILLAGLVSLPKEPYQAVKIDGASTTQTFFFITLPLMKPVIFVALLLRAIFAFKTFDLVYIMTGGGPGVSTDILSYYIYRSAFMGLDLASAAASSLILLGIVMVFILFFARLAQRT